MMFPVCPECGGTGRIGVCDHCTNCQGHKSCPSCVEGVVITDELVEVVAASMLEVEVGHPTIEDVHRDRSRPVLAAVVRHLKSEEQ